MIKAFDLCPVCKSIMIDPKDIDGFLSYGWHRMCPLEHSFYHSSDRGELTAFRLSFSKSVNMFWYWRHRGNYVILAETFKNEISIPWFEPDINDISKIINKIKTLIIFS